MSDKIISITPELAAQVQERRKTAGRRASDAERRAAEIEVRERLIAISAAAELLDICAITIQPADILRKSRNIREHVRSIAELMKEER